MSKRKFENIESDKASADVKSQKLFNSLDSDEEEEDDGMKYALKDEDIEGQEETGATMEEGVQLTPFNMKEEMEEGHFDKDGMYHWKKEAVVRDSWLDNIDWLKIKEKENAEKEMEEEESEDDPSEVIDVNTSYKKMLAFMRPAESVAATLKRLGGKGGLSASERLKLKKAGRLEAALAEAAENTRQVTEVTELADSILTLSGNMDVYQETYEQIYNKLNASTSAKAKAKEAVLDMYADDFEDKEKERLTDTKDDEEEEEEKETNEMSNETKWEMKKSAEAELEGPFSTEQMAKWADGGKLEEGSLVRKVGTQQFYNSKRIDFELYL